MVPNPTAQRLHAERDCTARTYECLLPLEYLLPDGVDNQPTSAGLSGGGDNQPTIDDLSGEAAGEEEAATQAADATNAH